MPDIEPSSDLIRKCLEQLENALLDAYPSWHLLRRMPRMGMDKRLGDVTSPHRVLRDQVSDLIEWAEGAGKVGELVRTACRMVRANGAGLRTVAQELGLTLDAESDTERAVRSVQTGLRAIVELLPDNAGEQFAGFRASLQHADSRLQRVAFYKHVHEWLHRLQFQCFATLVGAMRLLPATDARTQIELDSQTLGTVIAELRELGGDAGAIDAEFPWIEDKLVPAHEFLAHATETWESVKLQFAISSLRDVIQIQPTVVDALLLQAVAALDLPALVQSLRAVTDQLKTYETEGELLYWIRRAFTDLEQLSAELQDKVQLHRAWQRADNSLRLFAVTLGRPLEEITVTWSQVSRNIDRVLKPRERWSEDLSVVARIVAPQSTPACACCVPGRPAGRPGTQG